MTNPFVFFWTGFGKCGFSRYFASLEAPHALRVPSLLQFNLLQLPGQDYCAHAGDMQPFD